MPSPGQAASDENQGASAGCAESTLYARTVKMEQPSEKRLRKLLSFHQPVLYTGMETPNKTRQLLRFHQLCLCTRMKNQQMHREESTHCAGKKKQIHFMHDQPTEQGTTLQNARKSVMTQLSSLIAKCGWKAAPSNTGLKKTPTNLGVPLQDTSCHPVHIHKSWPVSTVRRLGDLSTSHSNAEKAKKILIDRFVRHLASQNLINRLRASTSRTKTT